MKVHNGKYTMENLQEIITKLRSPQGCPWDREQTHESIRRNFIEETYEAVEAIDLKDTALLREELGDVLLQILLHSEMEREEGTFDFHDVVNDLAEKLAFRHPHVFGEKKADSATHALDIWEEQKKMEKKQEKTSQSFDQVSKALPALMYSEKVQKRGAKAGFDYENVTQAVEHLKEEIKELERAMTEKNESHIHEELGDVLFSTVNVARFLKVDPEHALVDSTAKFISRYKIMEQLGAQRGVDLGETSLKQLNRLWEEAKDIH